MLATMLKWLKIAPKEPENAPAVVKMAAVPPAQVHTIELDLRPDDPFRVYLLGANGVVEIDRLKLASPALNRLKFALCTAGLPGRVDRPAFYACL